MRATDAPVATQLSGADGCNQFTIVGNSTSQRVTCPNSGGATAAKYKYPPGAKPIVTISGPSAYPLAAVYIRSVVARSFDCGAARLRSG